jgi:hypothetical protein
MGTLEYLKRSVSESQKNRKEYEVFGRVTVFIKDPLPREIDLVSILARLEKNVPTHLVHELDAIYIGKFPDLDARQVESVYLNGAIFITNENQTEEMFYNGLVHEMAHSVEGRLQQEIYSDGEIIEEFLGKRKKLMTLLEAEGLRLNQKAFYNLKYTKEFDEFLYEQVGYDRLNVITVGLFVSPYAATSLSEYFANGFENYFSGESAYVRKISPKLYSKIKYLTSEEM